MKHHYEKVIRYNELHVPGILAYQSAENDGLDGGGWVSPETGYAEPGASAPAAATLIALYCCPDSRYAGDPRLLTSARRFLGHLLRNQHPNGTLDLRATNFHDATMVGFCAQTLGFAYRLVTERMVAPASGAGRPSGSATAPSGDDGPSHASRETGEAALESVRRDLESFLRRGGEGMLSGGFHTPNHRWVLASALSLLYSLFADDRYRSEAEAYLAEGIDCNSQGEYTERSVGIYNATVDRSLIIVAEELGRLELLEPVCRNLSMVFNYIEPDGSLCTMNSRRQDQSKRLYPLAYYDSYLLMAHARKNASYAGAADAILKRLMLEPASEAGVPVRPSPGDPAALLHFLLRPDLRENDVVSEPPPATYAFENPSSGIVRVREEGFSATILANKTSFLKVQSGRAAASLRLAATFYGEKGRFSAARIETIGGGYRLHDHREWGYVRPLSPPPASPDWESMPHDRRAKVNLGEHDVSVDVQVNGSSAIVRIVSVGVENVMWRLEIILPGEGSIRAPTLEIPATPDGWALLNGDVTYTLGADSLRIAGGRSDHAFARSLRGAEEAVAEAFTLYCTGYTPMDETIEVTGRSFAFGPR